MKKILILILSFLATSSLTFGASNLWEYHKEKGLEFPSFEERKDIFENEIGNEEYKGTASQNKTYLDYLAGFSELKLGAGVIYPFQGGLGTSAVPTYGQLPVGNSGGTYTLTATSSLGITGTGSGASPDWVKQTNYGVLTLTASTTIPYWAKSAFYASSTSVFQGLATFGNASTSQISATNSYLGTVLTGTWNGTSIGNAYVDDDITLTNITQITNRAITDTTGTLTVARGGTGQTVFGQGWLNSNGTDLSASTSPTVNYFTATSTTATSTFPYLSITTNSNLGTVVGGTWQGTAIGDAYLTKSGDWTGTIDSNNFAGGAIGAGELIYGGSAGSFSELAVSTNGFVLALSEGIPAWVATTTLSTISGTLDISSQSNLTAGTNITLTNDDLSVDDAFVLNTGDVGTGVYDFGGATSLEIVNGANPTVDTTGEIAVDTTSGQFKWYDGIKTQIITGTSSPAFNIASTTLDAMGKSFNTATSTFLLKNDPEAITLVGFYCKASTTGTALIRFGDGTNWTETGSCSTGSFTLTTTNNTFTAFEDFIVQASSTAGAVSRITITTVINKTAD